MDIFKKKGRIIVYNGYRLFNSIVPHRKISKISLRKSKPGLYFQGKCTKILQDNGINT